MMRNLPLGVWQEHGTFALVDSSGYNVLQDLEPPDQEDSMTSNGLIQIDCDRVEDAKNWVNDQGRKFARVFGASDSPLNPDLYFQLFSNIIFPTCLLVANRACASFA